MGKSYKTLLSLILILFSGKILLSQSFVFKNYTTQDGLPSSETYFSAQDENGYMWIATDRGIAKFDGYNFVTYTTDEGMPDNTIFEFFNDHKNRLWFKGFSSLVGYIKNDSISHYKYNNVISSISPSQMLSNFAIDENDNLWFTKFYLKSSHKQFDRCFLVKIDAKGNIDTSYNVYSKDKKRIYITNNGKALVTGDLYATEAEFFLLNNKKKIAEVSLTIAVNDDVITRELSKDYYVAIVGREVVLFKQGEVKKIHQCKSQVIHFFADKDENIWIGYRDKGYEYLSAESNYTKVLKGLGGQTISSISQDNEGGMWLTSLENGVHYLEPQAFTSMTDEHGLTSKKVDKVINVDDNIIVLGGDNKILLKRKGKEIFKVIKHQTIYSTGDVEYVKDKAIFSFDPLLEQVSDIKNIVIGEQNELFAGTNHLLSLFGKTIYKFTHTGVLVDSINCGGLSRVWCILEKNDDEILIGTLKGLYLYKNKQLFSLKEKTPLYKHRIKDIKRIDNNNILVATIGGGLLLIDESDFYNPKQYKVADGLPSIMCNVVWKENDTTIWVGTNKGVCIISNILNKEKTTFSTINTNDGLTSNEINNFCALGNDIWVATVNNITIINKLKYLKESITIPVYIKDIAINGKLTVPIPNTEIKYKNNNISISFIGINFQYANQLEYKYRLKNTESKWNYTKSRSVVYSSLPAGKYVFEVCVVKPKGGQNPTYAYYSFTILPPFWQTPWFIISVIIGSLLLIVFFIRIRISFVREQERLKHDLNTFRDKALRGQMNPHFIYNSLNAIQNYILKNDTESSASFLSKFSQLMRLTFNNTAEELIFLEKEIEGLELYAELENLRFNQKFSLHVTIDKDIDRSIAKVPPLIMQPFVENAVLHGLLTKQGKGNIWVDIKLKRINNKKSLEIAIKDDGIGLKNAEKILERKTRFKNPFGSKNKRKNSGIKTTQDRIQQIWGRGIAEHNFKIVDLQSENNSQTGTLVLFYLPIYD